MNQELPTRNSEKPIIMIRDEPGECSIIGMG